VREKLGNELSITERVTMYKIRKIQERTPRWDAPRIPATESRYVGRSLANYPARWNLARAQKAGKKFRRIPRKFLNLSRIHDQNSRQEWREENGAINNRNGRYAVMIFCRKFIVSPDNFSSLDIPLFLSAIRSNRKARATQHARRSLSVT